MAVSLPADTANAAYAPAILQAVQNGDFNVTWGTVTSEYKGHKAVFRVFADALKMDVVDPNGVTYPNIRISVSAYLQQQIADVLECNLLTPKLADMLWLQRNVTLVPTPRVITSLTKYMISNSQAIDAQIAAQGNPSGIIQTVGKHWVIDASETNHPTKAENYGWHFSKSFGGSAWAACASDPTNPNCREIQDPGWFHDNKHLDYSQTCILVSRLCMLDGVQTDINTILSDASLAPLASHNGVIHYLRQPGVPVLSPLVKKPPCVGPGCPTLVSWGGDMSEFSSGPDWKAVAFSAGALVLVVGGFFGGLALLGGVHRRSPGARMREGLIAADPISPYVFDYRGTKTVIEKKRSGWCFKAGKTSRCEKSFRNAVVAAKNLVDADLV
jgi:hypothetical protein